MKKRLLVLLTILCGAIGIFALGACDKSGNKTGDCEHSHATVTTLSEANCTEDGSNQYNCPDCGKQWTEAVTKLGHDYKKDTKHSVEMTCLVDGRDIYVCSRCDDTYTETFEAPGHDYKKDTEHSADATCLAAGHNTYACSRCDDTYTEPTEQLSHDYQPNAAKTRAASCTAAGHLDYKCTLCNDEYSVPVQALGHAWEGNVCEDQECGRCDATRPATTQHAYVLASSSPVSCMADGVDVYKCRTCGDEYTETTLATGHRFLHWIDDEEGTLKEGEKCVYIFTRTSTCENDGCGFVETDEYEETHHTLVTRIKTPATCTQEGVKETYCSVCKTVDDTKTKKYTDTSAHKWNEGVESNGKILYTCEYEHSHTKQSIVSTTTTANVTKDDLLNTEITTQHGSIEMSESAQAGLDDGEFVFTMDKADKGSVSSSKELPNDVFSITLAIDGKYQTTFEGSITVRIPYELQDGDDVDAIVVWYVNENGDIENVEATYSNGYAVFETNHFSYYTVSKLTPAEMCEIYGHNNVERIRAATCTEDGYKIVVCTRCGEIVERADYTAKGHDFETETTPATCTTAGLITSTCKNCKNTVTTKIAAIGHRWELDTENSHAATCTASGSQKYVCANDSEHTYTVTVPQLPHSYTRTVVAPTCTETGYTQYACANCDANYRSDYVAANGHMWNLTAPTCGEGQICEVCGERGLPATGEHTFNEKGICSVCGQGCAHDFKVVEVIPSTCLVRGYTEYKCSICDTTKRDDYQPLAGHSYKDGKCTVCGEADPAEKAFYETLYKSFLAEAYAIDAKDLHIESWSYYDDGKQAEYSMEGNIEVLEAYIRFTEEGGYILYVEGSVESANKVYDSNGDVVYTETFASRFYMYTDGEYTYIKETDEDGNWIYQRTKDSVVSEESSVSMLLAMLTSGPVGEYLAGLYNANTAVITGVFEKLMKKFFTREELENGYRVQLNNGAMTELNDALYELSVEKFIDKYFGSGTYNTLAGLITRMMTELSVRETIDTVFVLLSDYGIEKKTLFDLINGLAEQMTGEPFDINDYYNKEEFTQVTIAQLIEANLGEEAEGMVAEQLDNIITMLRTASVYDLIFSSLEEIGPSADMIHGMINSVFAGDLSLSLVTDKKGQMTRLEVAVDDYNMEMAGMDGEGTLAKLKLSGAFSIIWNAEKTVDSSEIDGVSSIMNKVRAAVEAADGRLAFEGGEFMMAGGRLVLTITDSREMVMDWEEYEGQYMVAVEFYRTSYIFDDVESLDITVSADCGKWSEISLYGGAKYEFTYGYEMRIYNSDGELVDTQTKFEDWDSNYSEHASASFYFNSDLNKFSGDSQHDYELDEKRSQTEDDVTCGEEWVEYYICKNCKEEHKATHKKQHEDSRRLVLVDGAKSCEDGVIWQYYCTVCGEILHESEPSYEHMMDRSKELIETPHGTFALEIESCLCGEELRYAFEDYHGEGCRYEYHGSHGFGSPSRYEELENGHMLFTYNCAYGECTSYLTVEVWQTEDICYTYTWNKVFFHDGDTILGNKDGYTFCARREDHHAEEEHEISRIDYSLEKNGYNGFKTVREYTGCAHNSARTETREYREDHYGRPLLDYTQTVLKNGKIAYFYKVEFVYNGCDYRELYYTSADEFEETSRGVRHANNDWDFAKETCTQYGFEYAVCPVCNEIAYGERGWEPRGHQFNDGRCELCGLEAPQEASGSLLLEDMTGRLGTVNGYNNALNLSRYADGYLVGMAWWYEDKFDVETVFEFVWLSKDANGGSIEHLERFELGSDQFAFFSRIPEKYNSYFYQHCRILWMDRAAVDALLTKYDVEGCYMGVRVTFLPVSGLGNYQVTSITLTDDESSEHEFVKSEELSVSYEKAKCESYYYDVEVCIKCGYTHEGEKSYKWHNPFHTQFAVGESCLDGVVDGTVCNDCGIILDNGEMSDVRRPEDHCLNYVYAEEIVFKSECGTITVVRIPCACGQTEAYYAEYDGCKVEHLQDGVIEETGHEFMLEGCTECGIFILHEYYTEEADGITYYYHTFQIYSKDETPISDIYTSRSIANKG